MYTSVQAPVSEADYGMAREVVAKKEMDDKLREFGTYLMEKIYGHDPSAKEFYKVAEKLVLFAKKEWGSV